MIFWNHLNFYLKKEKKNQEVIYEENKGKIFGAGAKLKREANNKIREIDAEMNRISSTINSNLQRIKENF